MAAADARTFVVLAHWHSTSSSATCVRAGTAGVISRAPGGAVLANLWHGSDAARAAADAFARQMCAAVGDVYSVRVVGQEANVVLVALAPAAGAAARPPRVEGDEALSALRRRLREAAAAPGVAAAEPALLECMRSNAATLERYSR